MSLGFSTFILDVPFSPEDLDHTAMAFGCAERILGTRA